MRIATWNVNSIRARLDHVEQWLATTQPDVLCLQETKVTDDAFPMDGFARLGYEIAHTGQKTYNGVAIVARHAIRDIQIGHWDAQPSDECRLIAGTVQGVRIYSAYIPNGKSLDSPSYQDKLEWLARLRATLDRKADPAQPLVVGGDFNVARDGRDVPNAEEMEGQIFFSQPEREAIQHVLDFGLEDAFRLREEEGNQFTWWDYRQAAFRRNLGLRIDYLFVSSPVARTLTDVHIDREPRTWEKPSDHTPVVLEFDRAACQAALSK